MAVADDVLISMKDIKKIFYTDEVETHALSGVNLEIRRGEYVCVAGPSGSGKSTLLAILGLLDSPSEGQYFLKNESVENLDVAQRAAIRNREIGFIFQSFNLIGDLSVYENVELPLTYRGMSNRERKRRGLEALSRVGMSHRTGHFPSQLSGGQQQRVAVARALAGSPSILLADEPTGNLDSRSTEDVLRIFARLNEEGRTVVLITHEPDVAAQTKRVVRLSDGQVVGDERSLAVHDAPPAPQAQKSAHLHWPLVAGEAQP
jgi:putative ABC transport system ATP-binding protein